MFHTHHYSKQKNNPFNHSNLISSYSTLVEGLVSNYGYPQILGDVFIAMLKLIATKNWEGACHPSSSILYVIYTELGFKVSLNMGEVKIDHRYFDHSWIEFNGLKIDASLLNPLNKKLNLSPIFLDIDLNTNQPTPLQYGAVSSLGLSEFTEIIYSRPFHKYMNPFPWGKGKWEHVEKICHDLNLQIDLEKLPQKYRWVKRNLIRL